MANLIGFNNKYPYTDFHELNLDWLLETYQEIIDSINTLNTWMAEHKIEYQDALAELNRIANEIDTFEAQIQAQFDQLKEEQAQAFAEQTAKLNLAIAQMTVEVQAELDEFRVEFNQAMADFTTQFNQIKLAIQQEIVNLRVLVNQEIIRLNNLIIGNNEYIQDYVENRLDQFLDDFPTILVNVPVYNPVRGELTTIQQAINDIYDMARMWGLTAMQYDSLGLTAQEYDNLSLTALEYDQNGYIALGYPDENWYMVSPFTGQYTKVKNVVMDLAHLHMDGLSTKEYDDLELEAETYDDKQITSFDYDWFGKNILTA